MLPHLVTQPPRVVSVRSTPQRGRGVFAEAPIEEGAIIESCPILRISAEEMPALMGTVLGNYLFQWGGTRDEGAVALGYGSLYNHSADPNALYVRKVETLDFVALRNIAPGEEITVSYHGGFGDKSPVWFEVK